MAGPDSGRLVVADRPGGETAFRPLDEVLAAVHADLPAGAVFGSTYYPRTDASAWWARYTVPEGNPKAGLMQWMWPLHSGQFLGMSGRFLVCMSGIACAVLFVTGLIRWRQKRRSAKHRAARQAA